MKTIHLSLEAGRVETRATMEVLGSNLSKFVRNSAYTLKFLLKASNNLKICTFLAFASLPRFNPPEKRCPNRYCRYLLRLHSH